MHRGMSDFVNTIQFLLVCNIFVFTGRGKTKVTARTSTEDDSGSSGGDGWQGGNCDHRQNW